MAVFKFRIAALNESFSDENSDDDQHIRESTKEAKEAEAYSLYNKALGLQRHGNTNDAEEVLHELVEHDFLLEASETLEEKGHDAVHPGLPLLYSIQKNLAAIATQRKDYTTAMEFYLAAVKIDNSEVTVWYKMGLTALQLEDYQLAKVVLVEGLECNPKHWPCLDKIIPILYSLDNYFECLFYISKAFELDIQYEKGHAFRNKILQEQPMLESYTQEFFTDCDLELHTIHIQPEDTKEFIDAALHMRKRRQELSRAPEPVRLEFPATLQAYKWQCVGKLLIDLYDKAASSHPPISMALKVIVPDYSGIPSKEEMAKTTADNQHMQSNSPICCDEIQKMDVDEDNKEEQSKDLTKPVTENRSDIADTAATVNNTNMMENRSDIADTAATVNNTNMMENRSDIADTAATVNNTNMMENRSDIADTAATVNNTNMMEKEADSENPDIPFTSYQPDSAPVEDKMEIDVQVDDTREDKVEAASAEEEDDSLMEAVNTAHNLIDSLSPIRAPDPNLKPKLDNIPKFDIDNPEDKGKGNTNQKDKSQSAAPEMIKSSSYGFVVSDVMSPECTSTGSDLATSQGQATHPLIVCGASEDKTSAMVDPILAVTSSTPVIINTLSTPSLSHTPSDTVPNLEPTPTTLINSLSGPVNSSASSSEPTFTSSQQDPALITSTPFQQSALSASTTTDNHPQNSGQHLAKSLSDKVTTDGSGDCIVASMPTQGEGHPDIPPVSQSLQSSIDPILAMEIDEQEQAGRRAQKRRRISQATEEIMMYGKRRSSRVRNTGRKKEEETVNFSELLMEFLPPSLKIVQEEDGETDKPESDADVSIKSSETSKSGHQLDTQEQLAVAEVMDEGEGVMAYLQSCQKNAGLIYLMKTYLSELARRFNVTWPASLIEVYKTVYEKARKHMYIPSLFNQSEDSSEVYQEISKICLLWTELVLDMWLTTRSKTSTSPVLSPCCYNEVLEDEDIPDFYDDDILYLTRLCSNSELLGTVWIEHCIRVYWMQARYLVLRGNMEEAFVFFNRTKQYLEYGRDEMGMKQVLLPNCKMDTIVNLELVTCQYDQLEKNQSLAETQRLYENKEFDKVVNILLQTFSQPKSKMMKMISDPSERQSQLILLQDALSKTNDYPRCLIWGEESFNETYYAYKSASKPEEKTDWINTMVQIMLSLQSVLEKKPDVVQSLPSRKLVRFSQHLVQLIDTNMGLPESVTTMVIDTVLPWILLYLLIKHEDKFELEKPRDDESGDSLPSSFMLLNIAHDYLGSRGWCTKSDGALLLFIMRVMRENMDADFPFLDDYQQAYEQCIYCLYGHPNKRAKAKHLQDHNGTALTLEWDQAVDIFDYFKPKIVPEFDGYTSEKISAELEVLLKRIISLVPDTSKTMGVPVEDIQSYIEGAVATPPVIPQGREVTLPVIGEIFYLLADYYLKNKEALKAVKFYIQDLCMNPTRLDSWAGMALARMSQLEAKLTSTELKMDAPIYKKSIAALRCFKRAVEIDDCNGKLWIEYGTLAYTLHSHASHQIQWKKWFAMDDEMVQIAKDSKREMVQTAQDCFRMASLCESDAHDEEWLYNYMQGKCHEKMRKPLKEFLSFYFKAEEIVHEENAKYPKKIVYAYTTPHLSVEALELYYRIHSAILKVLIKQKPDSGDIDFATCIRAVTEAANLPFVSRKEKGSEGKSEHESASSADESSSSAFSSPFGKKGSSNRQGDHKDHTYFRQKSTPSTPAQPVELKPSVVIDGLNVEKESSSSFTTSEQPIKEVPTTPVVKTIELFSEDQKSQEDVKLTSCPKLVTSDSGKSEEASLQNKLVNFETGEKEAELSSAKDENPCKGDEPAEDRKEDEQGASAVDSEVDKDIKKDSKSQEDVELVEQSTSEIIREGTKADKPSTEQSAVDKEMDTSQCKVEENEEREKDNKSKEMDTNEDTMEGQQERKIEEIVEVLMKKPPEELHRYLIDRCRVALEICLQRFPTHYKSHYRLAHLYMHSPYHKDLSKAKDILFGVHKWQQHPHMPCQGLFYERKPTKFFQGIWKIPIDEIDRSGSFPSHLNRCISLALHVLKELKDSSTLHQVHLQLNRQPEPGKKYLRDAEKKYYALMSHRFTLEASQAQIEDMRTTAEMEVRLKFLLTMYKIWEHGVHKLNRFVDKTNRLLAEAYRVVTRKLETLPQSMLLDQAVRFCKHQISQKHLAKTEKAREGVSDNGDSKATSNVSREHFTDTVGIPRLMNLANINKRPTNYSMVKADQAKQAGMSSTNVDNDKDGDNTSKDVIEISDSPVEAVKRKQPETENIEPGSKKSTVKIKMGLLQAVKRLKPSPGESESPGTNTDKDSAPENIDESESEIQTLVQQTDEEETGDRAAMDIDESSSSSSASSSSSSSSSSSDSSSSSSSDDEDADNEQEEEDNENADYENKSEKTTQSEGSSDSDDDDDDNNDNESDSSESDSDDDSSVPVPVKKPPIKLKPKPPPEDDEMDVSDSSDSEAEIDLVSSEDADKDDDKDEDYKASDDEIDEDVILIPEEFTPKGRAIIPSPPHKNKLDGDEFTEVLVASVPDIDPLISSLMSTEEILSVSTPAVSSSESALKNPERAIPSVSRVEAQRMPESGKQKPIGSETLKAMLGQDIQKPKIELQRQTGPGNQKTRDMENLKAMLEQGIKKPKVELQRQSWSGTQKSVGSETLRAVLGQDKQKPPMPVGQQTPVHLPSVGSGNSNSSGNESAIMIIDSDDE